MATLNLSTNGPSITKSYQNVVNAPPPSGQQANSSTYGQWAVYSVQAPLVSAFQAESGKESVLKVQTTGEGELADLVEEFSDGRIQFAFVKVKDPNTTLPKCVLIAWCGEGVPERTKGYFTSHLAAVSKLLHGYHVQVTARSDTDLTPEGIIQKVADASGSKYSGGPTTSAPSTRGPPPPVTSKPIMPTRVGSGGAGFNPMGARSRVAPSKDENTDSDGWGADAPPVTRSQLEKVESAYKPTKVNMAELASQKPEPRLSGGRAEIEDRGDVVKGAYQPIGKVDIAEIRRQARESGSAQDDRPAPVKGSYEPVGKVDIAAIRARAQGPSGAISPPSTISPSRTGTSARSDEREEAPKSLAERSAAFSQSERLTSMPKPKVSNKFGSSTSTFTGTKAPTPAGFTAPKPSSGTTPVGAASRTFADEGGKTPAQIWAEKKARERGSSGTAEKPPAPGIGGMASPVASQPSGEGGWKSGYTGKSWAPVQTVQSARTGQSATSNLSDQRTGEQPEEPASPGNVSAIRDRFKGAPPMGAAAPPPPSSRPEPEAPAPPPMDLSSKPNAGARGVPIPGLPTGGHEERVPAEQRVSVPSPPPQPRSPSPEPDEDVAPSSPVRIAMPVSSSRGPDPVPSERTNEGASALPAASMAAAAGAAAAGGMAAEPQIEDEEPGRQAAQAVAAAGAGAGGRRALVQYDYEKAEDNEIELREGEYVTNIDMVDPDWWSGINARGDEGLFPSNYVELVEDDDDGAGAAAPAPAPPAPGPAAAAEPEPESAGQGHTATALYDYEAAEDNELSFPDGATITNIEFPDDDWWSGMYGGKMGLFPANYVQLDE
ncbi:hypothetical protein BDY21DRAFT_361767 [Lineolata rhizophorae]|uniref:ADF-H domain-containing protein n=1 Tax=Lineolata rhizophorae TaxID=578093 RepID=A0A6A6P7A0_9PEZI|nr:hypothetical protein BDY21DRAFT_361767 [Lineolata rhizophorae]